MLYYWLFNLFIYSCYNDCNFQCINWLTDFTKIIALHNGYDEYNQPRVLS